MWIRARTDINLQVDLSLRVVRAIFSVGFTMRSLDWEGISVNAGHSYVWFSFLMFSAGKETSVCHCVGGRFGGGGGIFFGW